MAAREDVNMIVPELWARIWGRTMRDSSTGERTLISIEYHQSSALVRWKGMKVFVPALQIRMSMVPRSVFTWRSASVLQGLAQVFSSSIDTLTISSRAGAKTIEGKTLSLSHLFNKHLQVLPLQPICRHPDYFLLASSSFQHLLSCLLDLTLRPPRHAHASAAVRERLGYFFTDASARSRHESNLAFERAAEDGRINGGIDCRA